MKSLRHIWIDFENTPQVYFFSPIIECLKSRGFDFTLTARPFSQTKELADHLGLPVSVIGSRKIYDNYYLKAFLITLRGLRIALAMVHRRPLLCLSHGSRGLAIASCLLGIPHIGFFDYDHSDTDLFHKIMHHVYVPQVAIENFYKVKKNVYSGFFRPYPGIKEEVYIAGHKFEQNVLKDLNIPNSSVRVLCRPPGVTAHYSNIESERLFELVLNRAINDNNVHLIITSRTSKESGFYRERYQELSSVHVLNELKDGLSLINEVDLLVGGGGTMNREACVLGVPVYSVFKGSMGSIDSWLADKGMMKFVNKIEDVNSIPFVPRSRRKNSNVSTEALDYIVSSIEKDYETITAEA